MYGYETRIDYGMDCFFILPNGKFLLAEYNQSRISVHFELFLAMDDIFNPEDIIEWKIRQEKYQIIRIVPECNFIILSKDQLLTEEQKRVVNLLIEDYNIDIHYYECEYQTI